MITLIRATKVQAVIKGLKRIPFLGGAVDEVIEGSAGLPQRACASNHQDSHDAAVRYGLPGRGRRSEGLVRRLRPVDQRGRPEDRTEALNVPRSTAHSILAIGGAEIIRDAVCPNWAGWTPASAAVSVTANKAGTFKVASESYVNGYLDNMELYSPADSVDWSTNVEEKDVEVVGPDLYTGS